MHLRIHYKPAFRIRCYRRYAVAGNSFGALVLVIPQPEDRIQYFRAYAGAVLSLDTPLVLADRCGALI